MILTGKPWPNLTLNRSSHSQIIGILKKFAKFTGKHLYRSLFFNKVAGLQPATLLKKRLWYWCSLLNFAEFFRKPFLQNTSRGCFCLTIIINPFYGTVPFPYHKKPQKNSELPAYPEGTLNVSNKWIDMGNSIYWSIRDSRGLF